jgi:hypothetical protein
MTIDSDQDLCNWMNTMTDAVDAVGQALKTVVPGVTLGMCWYHIHKSVKVKCSSEHMSGVFEIF